jgi:hypothetical protein
MRYFSGLIFLAIMAYLGWPYYHVYQLNEAVGGNDKKALNELVDFVAVNDVYKKDLEWKAKNTVGAPGNSWLPEALREKAQGAAAFFGELTAEAVEIDASEMLERFHKMDGSVWKNLTFAFFESPTRFTVRLGKLGRNPIHIQMTLQDWYWRVTAVYL